MEATSGGSSLSSGQLGAAIANELGKMISDFVGRGATRSRAFVHNDLIVLLLEDGATRAEVNLVAAGHSELVRHQRDALQRAMEDDLVSAIEVFVLEPEVPPDPGSGEEL
jgi:uncharacterized protein YbcI